MACSSVSVFWKPKDVGSIDVPTRHFEEINFKSGNKIQHNRLSK